MAQESLIPTGTFRLTEAQIVALEQMKRAQDVFDTINPAQGQMRTAR
jgi:hypothetical protein